LDGISSRLASLFCNFFAPYQDIKSGAGTLLEISGIIYVTDQKILGPPIVWLDFIQDCW
jgi:hypothetical protein